MNKIISGNICIYKTNLLITLCMNALMSNVK